jgi:hypothetical protein
MTTETLETPAVVAGYWRAAASSARVLELFQRQSRRGRRAHRHRAGAAGGRLRRCAGAAFALSDQQRGLPEAAGLAGGRLLELSARHRRDRPRHPLAPALWRAALAGDRHRVVALAMAIGIVLGLVAGFFKGITEIFIMR